ncbi:MAG TPA: DUF2269 family protein, partial [Candidatus Eisenbacteria bacterium]|nr:DUF2269 family protein [Candidatus Eisenbacteria bacterium]
MYEASKLLHIFAVVLFLGNITGGIFWKLFGDKTRDPRIIAHTMAGIIASDRLFTNPGAILILIGGITAALLGHYPILRTHWISSSIGLFALSGAAFGIRLVPLQRQLLAVARAGVEGTMDWDRYDKLSGQWKLWGMVALVAPLLAMVLMVLKPG